MHLPVATSKYEPQFLLSSLTYLPRGPSALSLNRSLNALLEEEFEIELLVERLTELQAVLQTHAGVRALQRYAADAKLNGWRRRLRGQVRSAWVGSLHPRALHMWQAEKLLGVESTLVILCGEKACAGSIDLRRQEGELLEFAPKLVEVWRRALMLWLLPRYDILHFGYRDGARNAVGDTEKELEALAAVGVRVFSHAFQIDDDDEHRLKDPRRQVEQEWSYPSDRELSIRVHRSQSRFVRAFTVPTSGRD